MRRISREIRAGIDEGEINFHNSEETPQEYQQIKRGRKKTRATLREVQQFLAGKAYVLGFPVSETLGQIWVADPWDAEYLGVDKKQLDVAARILKASGFINLDNPNYARPTDELIAQQNSEVKDQKPSFNQQRNLTLSNIPKAEDLSLELAMVLEESRIVAVLLIDLDHFKQVNDSKGHPEGTRCLESVVKALADALGGKGKLYRYGGDEFVAVLPNFNTEEARACAERIRFEIELSRLGGDIPVTTSIGICATDEQERTGSPLGP